MSRFDSGINNRLINFPLFPEFILSYILQVILPKQVLPHFLVSCFFAHYGCTFLENHFYFDAIFCQHIMSTNKVIITEISFSPSKFQVPPCSCPGFSIRVRASCQLHLILHLNQTWFSFSTDCIQLLVLILIIALTEGVKTFSVV